MTNCQVVKEKLGRFLDGELTREELSMVRAHIEGCPGCQQDLKAFQALSASLDAVPVPPVPASAVDVIMAARFNSSAPDLAVVGT